MKRIIMVLIFVVCFSSLIVLHAYDKESLIVTFENIIKYYNESNNEIYNYIDTSNKELYTDIRNNIGKGNITYNSNLSVLESDDVLYKIAALVDASGKVYNSDWSVKTKYIYFTFKYDEENDKYILLETDFFDASGINMLRDTYSKLFTKALIIAFAVFVVIILIVFVITKSINKQDVKKYKESLNN